jgi:hypothetical protein
LEARKWEAEAQLLCSAGVPPAILGCVEGGKNSGETPALQLLESNSSGFEELSHAAKFLITAVEEFGNREP